MRHLLLLCLTLALPVHAADFLADRFKKADLDQNGLLSKKEAGKGLASCLTTFDALDANRDGHLSLEELRAGNQSEQQQAMSKKK